MRLRVEVRRGGWLESVHLVSAAVVDEDEQVIERSGDPELPVFWRSAAKFFQALPVVESGAADRFGLTGPELALCCASHSGAPMHTAAAASILAKIGAATADLHCEPHPLLDEEEERRRQARGEPLSKLHNNCSGKHAGMLAVCRARGWPLDGYNRLGHPLQQELLAVMATVTSVPAADIQTAIDGCGAVVFRTPLSGMARALRRFAGGELPAPHRDAGRRLREALATAPLMMAGERRLCTDLITVTAGRLLGKVGAEGIYTVGARAPRGQERARGLALKVEDGAGRAAGPALCLLMERLGWLSPEEKEGLRRHWESPLANHQGERTGEIVALVE